MARKHVPERTCVACRRVRPKRELVRVVRRPEGGVQVDWTGKAPGRGAYIGPARECLQRALARRALERSLAGELSDEDRAGLETELYQRRATCPWPEEDDGEAGA